MGANGISIFLLVRSLEAGGAERQLVELARGLHRRGHVVTVAVFYKRGPLLDDLERAGVPVIDLRKRGRWDLVGFMARTVIAIRRARPDIVYSFLGGANIVASVARLFVPPMTMVWSIRSSNMDLARYDWLHKVAYSLECRLSRTADLIISNSHTGRDFAVNHGFPPDRIQIVPNGIDTERFRPEPKLRQRQRIEWALTDQQIAVGVLARLDPMKGHKIFLEAAARLTVIDRDMRFFILGAGPEEDYLRRLAADLRLTDILTFAGPIHHSEMALNGLDICCSSSVFGEGFSNSIAEAMACGVPCVVTEVGDSASIVGDTGEIVAPSDPDALAQAILSLRAKLYDGFKQRASRRINELYSVGSMLDRTIATLLKAGVVRLESTFEARP